MSSIVGRFLNYLLVILYSYTIPAESGGYGIVTNLYAWTALLLALLTFGMETTFFRYSGKEGEDPDTVYGTSLRMVGVVAAFFTALVFGCLKPVSAALGYASHPEYIGCFALITSFDAVQAIMFARLRQQKKALKFVSLKLFFIFASILLNLFVFLVMPKMFGRYPALENLYNSLDYGVGLIFFINLICTALVGLFLLGDLKGAALKFDRRLCRKMLGYAWPLLLLSLVGILNQVADKILFPYLIPGEEGRVQLGIYGACAKIAMIMAMLTQAFRYAYEPIVFGASKSKDSVETLASGMKYFIIFSLFAFMGVWFYLPIIKYMIGSSYWGGLGVVPVVMMAEIFMGIYFNLSFWYKLTDQTWWGAIMSAVGAVVMIGVNIIFVPKIGYWACAVGGFAGYGVAMLMSLLIGRKKYPVPYDTAAILRFCSIAAVLCGVNIWLDTYDLPLWVSLAIKTILIAIYGVALFREVRSEMQKTTNKQQ